MHLSTFRSGLNTSYDNDNNYNNDDVGGAAPLIRTTNVVDRPLERTLIRMWWQVFFGGVFDKRVGMLFADRSPDISSEEDGNLHSSVGTQKL